MKKKSTNSEPAKTSGTAKSPEAAEGLDVAKSPSKSVNSQNRKPNTKILKIIKVFSLIFLIGAPILTHQLFQNSNYSVSVELPQTLYTPEGEAVTIVNLAQRTGKILLYQKSEDFTPDNPIGIVRQGKSIRLGGYFYGLGDVSTGEAMDWFGNNIDVLSLGMCGSTFAPENISAIKAMNPLMRFYYMAFATTLFEGDANLSTEETWGNSHYPRVKFNETMHEWTLKYNNGTEALGVRRKSHGSTAHLMDLGSEQWAEYFAEIYETRAEIYHAEGVAIDEVMWRGYWGLGESELRDYNDVDEIIDTCYQWLETLDQSTEMEVITQAFWPEAQEYQDGVWGEIAFRAGGQYGTRVDDISRKVWYENMNWFEIVDNLKTIGENNESYIWAAWYERDNPEALEYSLATYLMGKPNQCTSVTFHPHPVFNGGYPDNLAGYSVSNVINEVENHKAYFDVELGAAQGNMYEQSGSGGNYFQRDFENGIVLINPYHASIPGLK